MHAWVGLAGHGGVGKSEVAKFLARKFKYQRLHVKDFLAESVAPILVRYGVPPDEVHHYTHGSKINDPLPKNVGLTARHLLQAQGGEFLQATDPDMMTKFWIDAASKSCKSKLLLESIRYARECALYREQGMFVVRIVRPGHEPVGKEHVSEADQSFPVDATVVNDGTLEELFIKVETLLLTKAATPKIVPIIINGPPQSGKDTFVKKFSTIIKASSIDVHVENISSIDGVREMFRSAGVDIDKKTPMQRDAMVYVGNFLEAECNFKSRDVVEKVLTSRNNGGTTYAFIHVREPTIIYKITELLRVEGLESYRLFVDRLPLIAPSNLTDDVRITDVRYDWIVANRGDLEQFDKNVVRMAEYIVQLKRNVAVASTACAPDYVQLGYTVDTVRYTYESV